MRYLVSLAFICGIPAACVETDSPCIADCSIHVLEDGRLGSIDGEDAFVSLFLTVSEVEDGTSVYDWNDPGRVRLYSSDGRFVRFIGRLGNGPGEFQHPAHVFRRASGEWVVFDRRTPRLTVLERELSRATETHPLAPFGAVHSVHDLRDGRLLVNGLLFTEEALGLPLHLLDENGRVVRSFGAETAILGSWDAGSFERKIAVGNSGRIWVAHRNEYRLELWDTSGVHIRTFERQPPWFTPVSRFVFFNAEPDNPPTPFVSAVWEAPDGRPWIYINTPRADWQDELQTATKPGPRAFAFRSTAHAMFETRIEVLDQVSGDPVATGMLPYGITQVSSSGRVFAPIIHNDVPLLQAWRTTLTSDGGSE
jgi:hypothetical protein